MKQLPESHPGVRHHRRLHPRLPRGRALFLGNGLIVGTFGGSLPGLRSLLDLGPGEIVGVLVAAALFAVLSMNVSGPLADRYGARLPSLVGGVVMVGAAAGDGFRAELRRPRGRRGRLRPGQRRDGRLHERARRQRRAGPASSGDEPAARVLLDRQPRRRPGRRRAGPAARGGHGHPRRRCGPAACSWLCCSSACCASYPSPRGGWPRTAAPGEIPSVAWLLAAMAVCFGLTEGTAIDWSSLHVAEVGDVSPSAGAWGLACVAGFMVVIRLLGDLVVERLGRAVVVRAGLGVRPGRLPAHRVQQQPRGRSSSAGAWWASASG